MIAKGYNKKTIDIVYDKIVKYLPLLITTNIFKKRYNSIFYPYI